MRGHRMLGLDSEQLDELVWRIENQLEEPWHKGIGRPKDLSLREAIVVACGYMRQNITQEVWAEIFDASQPVISGIVTEFTPLIEASTDEDRPTVDEAKQAAAREQTVLVDGFLAPTCPGAIHQNCGRNTRRPASTARLSRASGAISFSCPNPLPGIITT